MKWLSLILIGYLVPACFAEILVQENFEGTTFPPVGWTTGSWQYEGTGGWGQDSETGNHYAFGSVQVIWAPPVYGWAKAWLNTSSFNLTSGDTLIIDFDTRVDSTYLDPTIEIKLYGSKLEWHIMNTLWNQHLWKHYTYEVPITRTDNYFVQFMIDPRMTSYQWNSRDVDNVVLTRTPGGNQLNINPTTLGRIKSAYK